MGDYYFPKCSTWNIFYGTCEKPYLHRWTVCVNYTKVSEWHIVPVGNRIEQLNQVSEYAVEDIQEQGYFTREEAKTAIDRYIKLRKL